MNTFAGYTKGINLGGWLSQCVHTKEHYESFISESDIEKIASWGMDHVRLPVDYNLVQKDSGELIEEGCIYIDRCISWCRNHGLNMVLDLHRTAGYSFDDTDENKTFLHSPELQERFYLLWEQLSARFGSEEIVAFELLNEIDALSEPQLWNDIARTAIAKIRVNAPLTSIIVGGINGNSIVGIEHLAPPSDEHIVYNFHFYDPLIVTHQSAYWIAEMPRDFRISYPCPFEECMRCSEMFLPGEKNDIYSGIVLDTMDVSFMDIVISRAARIAQERGVPLYCGEYGMIDLAEISDSLNWFRDIHMVFRKYGIGHAAWNYKGLDFDLSGKRYDDVRKELLAL